MIKTKSIYSPIDKDDGLRVLITRFYPRGVKREKYDIWIRPLSPSAELLKKFKNSDIIWEDFKSSLLEEICTNIDSVEAIRTLHMYNTTQDITLLCYEKDGSPCHRYMVRDLIENPGTLESSFVSKCINQKPHFIIHDSDEENLIIP